VAKQSGAIENFRPVRTSQDARDGIVAPRLQTHSEQRLERRPIMTARNLLEMIYEYTLLRAKRDHLAVPLDEEEQMRLVGLGQLLAGEGDASREARAMPRLPFPKQVSFTLPGGFEAGEVKNLSGKGIAIATGRPPAIGTRVIVRMVDDGGGTELFFPCRVVWSRRAPLPGMGLVFDGVPTKSAYVANEDTGVWKRSFTIGTPRKDTQAA
jgi:hypothetical protein